MKKSLDSRPKIVCLVINDLQTDQRMQRICSSLSDAGYQVTLVGRILPSSVSLPERNFEQIRLKCYINKGFLFYAEYNIRLFIYLLFNSFSIINAIDLDTIVPAFFVSKLKGVKMVYDAHEWFPECPEIVVRPKIKRFWQIIEKIFVPRADKVYTVSASIAGEFKERYHQQTDLVCNMPLKSAYVGLQKNPETQQYILYQGALNKGRGLEAMLLAMQYIETPLWIAGDGDITLELKDLAKEIGVTHKVKFLGKLHPEELKIYTVNAWLGINLFENLGYNYYYSLANKFFDYVQAGIPQLTMDFPEYKRMNSQFEVAVLTGDLNPDKIANYINDLQNDINIYLKLQLNCKKAAEIWNWENESQHLKEIYASL